MSVNKYNSSTGELERIAGGSARSLNDLIDTNITTPTNNQVLAYDSTSSKWINSVISPGQTIQVLVLPTASQGEEGKIYQYIGATTSTLTNGYFYKCVSDGETPATYSWVEADVMDVSKYVTAEEVSGGVDYSGIYIVPAPGTVTETMLDNSVQTKLNFVGVETFSGTTDPSSSLGKDGDIYFLID